jgi:adenylate cyclase class 2
MDPLEVEVKFFLSDPAEIRNRLLSLGAVSKGRFFETNIRYEDETGSLLRKGSLLRLRKDRKITLTFKSKTAVPDREFKVFQELEVEISDFQTMQNILTAIGFHQEQTYEKWRETITLQNLIFCLDTMPFGDFLEIEGDGTAIIESAKRLGLVWEQRILANYLAIFERIRTHCNLSFSDVTFSNFQSCRASFAPIVQSFQAG